MPTRPRSPRRSDPARTATHLIRSTGWAGLTPGDAVEVEGTRGARWSFVAHVHNERTGEEWVEVAGGRGREHAVRSFAPGRIFPAGALGPAGRSRQPSLADAPQLPL